MDELGILRAQVAILERQMKHMYERMHDWIEDFNKLLEQLSSNFEEEEDEME